MAKDKIEKLLDASGVTNEAMKAAIEKHNAEVSEQATERALRQLRAAKDVLDSSVENLRSVRSIEKKRKKEVTIVNDAYEAFKKNGDWDAFYKAVNQVGFYPSH